MDVAITWRETTVYRAVVTLEDEDVRKFMSENEITGDITDTVIEEYLDSREEDWVDQVDYYGSVEEVEDRDILEMVRA